MKNLRDIFEIRMFRAGVFVMLITFTLLAGQNTSAQGTRGSIRGTITDVNQAVVANATVKLIDAERGVERSSSVTDESGVYQFLEVEPATYNIVVTSTNFSETRLTDVKVEPNRNLTLDAVLTVGQSVTEVQVTASAELIDRESGTLGTTVDRRRVEGLPLNGRNVLSLALLQPGVTPATGFGGGSGIRVNGNRGVENNLTIDGGNNNEVAVGGAIGGQPRPDAVQEFRLLTSNFEPEFGRNTGAVINVVTKSGTNDFHGNARFFYRPSKLSAARYLDKALRAGGRPNGADFRRKFERKEYGFNIGGPIYFLKFGEGVPVVYSGKDKTFFFVDYERRNQDVGASQTISGLPNAAERAGNFSGLLGPVGSPECNTLTTPPPQPGVNCSVILRDPSTGNQFPGNIIPAGRFSPIGRFYLGFIPGGNSLGQAQVSANVLDINNYFTSRIDHAINDNNLLNFTYNYFDADSASPFAFGGSNVTGFGAADQRKTNSFIGRYTAIITPKVVNSFLFNYSRNYQPGVAPTNTTTPAQIGFTANFVANAAFAGPPNVRLLDRGLNLGNSIQGPQVRLTENIQFQDSVSYVLGSHRFKFGFDTTKYKQQTDFLFVNQGIFSYSADGLEGVTNTTGDDLADLLIGNTPAAVQFGAAGLRQYRQSAYAAFAQDSWRVTNNLTFSYGVRYEYNSPLTDLGDRVAYYRPGAISTLLTSGQLVNQDGQLVRIPAGRRAPIGLVFVGDPDPVLGGTVPRGGVKLDKNNFAPRVGLAYSFNGGDSGLFKTLLGENQTVIRAGIGLFYGAVIGDTALQQLSAPGFSGTNFFQFPASGTLADPFAPDPFPEFGGDQGQIVNPFGAQEFILQAPLSQFSQPIDPLIETPEVTQFNVTLERGFAKDYVASFSYVGNRGRKLYVREAANPALGTFFSRSLRQTPTTAPTLFAATTTTANANNRRANGDIPLALNVLTTGGNSNYDAFQTTLQKRFNDDGLLFQLSYTFSKTITDSDSQRGQLDLLDRSFGRGLSSDDHPHRFVGSFIYELPFFKNTNGFLKRVIDGWSIGGIYTYQSGDLITVNNPTDSTGTGGAIFSFADIGNQFTAANGQNDRQAFNADAFRSFNCGTSFTNTAVCGPTGFRRGTSGVNQFRLDNANNNVDFVVSKKIQLFSERNNLELRGEAFNLFNTTQFTTVNLNLSTPASFGKYTDTRESRVIQLALRLNF
jgi:Carboxypeptidase regulatory-like domain